MQLFFFFLPRLALDAERGDRPSFQPLPADLLSARLVHTLRPVFDPSDRLVCLLLELLFPAPPSPLKFVLAIH